MQVGVDIVQISRITKNKEDENFLKFILTDKEIEYCKRDESIAGIFAAKEAYFKAKGTGIDKRLNEIEVLHDEKGKPYFNGIGNCDLSISHDGDYAIAVVIMF